MRIFIVDGRECPDPDPNMSHDAARQWFANFLPELATAETRVSKRGEDDIIEFIKRVGVKG